MDQRALLRFIKENIYSYGGNPRIYYGVKVQEQVVMYHIFNPNNKDYFIEQLFVICKYI